MFPISDASHHKKGFSLVNLVLIAVTCYVFFLQLTTPDLQSFITQYALIPARVSLTDPSTWFPFFTSIFLHGGWLHIISNMWFLLIFGDNVEKEFGPLLYTLLYFASGIIGGLAQYILMADSAIPMLGASGAIAGVLGAYFALFPHNKVKTLIPIFGFITVVNINASVMLGYWFVLQVISGAVSLPGADTDQGGVAFWAHVGGFVTGFMIGKLLAQTDRAIEGEVIE